jgi:hypothetical protein
MHTTHPVFKPPPDTDGKIWQYMELAEFVSMLNRKALFFVKANKLRDPYEGIIPQYSNVIRSSGNKEGQKQNFQGKYELNHLNHRVPQTMIEQFQMYRQLVLINPWHYNPQQGG